VTIDKLKRNWHKPSLAECLSIGVGFEPRDLWIGVYISECELRERGWYRTIYVALLPTIIFHLDICVERYGI